MTEATITPAEKRLILSSLALVLLLSALDQTIVSTAMPRIIEQLQGLHLYGWVTTAYMLTSTVTVPIYGKLSDLYGRKPILVIGVLLFLTGSAFRGVGLASCIADADRTAEAIVAARSARTEAQALL